MAKIDREALLRSFPDIAALLEKAENGPNQAAPRRTGTKSSSTLTRTVRGKVGVRNIQYKAVDWRKVAANRLEAPKPGVVRSSGKKRLNVAKALIVFPIDTNRS